MMIPPGGEHGRVGGNITGELRAFARAHGLGSVLTEAGFVLARDPDTVWAPDVAFIGVGREIGRGYIEGAPDLAVEILSPSDRARDVAEKTAEWHAAGARLVWVVDPDAHSVTVHEPGCEPRTFGADDTLGGGSVLPGLALPVARIWD